MTFLSDHAASKVRRLQVGGTLVPSAEGPSIHSSWESKQEALKLSESGLERVRELRMREESDGSVHSDG
jgi:hypothetical protein